MPAKDAVCSQPQHAELARKVEELQERLDEETKVRPGGGSSLLPAMLGQRAGGIATATGPPGGGLTAVPSPAAPPEAGADEGPGAERHRAGTGGPAAGG